MTNLFLNQVFEKNRIRLLVLWSLTTFGEYNTLNFIEKLKDIGFYYATYAGLSLGIHDLLIPPIKSNMIIETEFSTKKAGLENEKGNTTPVERLQQMIDFWHRTSEILRTQVVQNFNENDKLNPVFMMAFSGARGNISQVRQLVGMRGLMADSDGQILDFPIRSNFREGLTLTEYIISCYGARKGVVDTALKTANSGYLTRRLVDVAHHIIITQFDCQTKKGIFISHTKINRKISISIEKKIVGRTILETIPTVIEKNQIITPLLAIQIKKLKNKILIRSPLTCKFKNSICQLCYGWSLSNRQLVSTGECVGIIAAQSIGEPGTQLTMRTFHTGGVFSGDVMEEIRSPKQGIIKYQQSLPGLLIRTLHGKIAYLTKQSSKIFLQQPLTKQSIIEFIIPELTILFIKNFEKVEKNKLLAEFSFFLNLKNKEIQTKYKIFSENDGEIFFEKVLCLQIKKKEGSFLKIGLNLGSIWLIHANIQKSQSIENFFKTGDIVTKKSILGTSFSKSNLEGYIFQLRPKNRNLLIPSASSFFRRPVKDPKFIFKVEEQRAHQRKKFFVNQIFGKFLFYKIYYKKLGYFFDFTPRLAHKDGISRKSWQNKNKFFISLGLNQKRKSFKVFYFQEFLEKEKNQHSIRKLFFYLFFYTKNHLIFTNLKKNGRLISSILKTTWSMLQNKREKLNRNFFFFKIEKLKKKFFGRSNPFLTSSNQRFSQKKKYFFLKKNFFYPLLSEQPNPVRYGGKKKIYYSTNFLLYYNFDRSFYKEKILCKISFDFGWLIIPKRSKNTWRLGENITKKTSSNFVQLLRQAPQFLFIKKTIFFFQENNFIQRRFFLTPSPLGKNCGRSLTLSRKKDFGLLFLKETEGGKAATNKIFFNNFQKTISFLLFFKKIKEKKLLITKKNFYNKFFFNMFYLTKFFAALGVKKLSFNKQKKTILQRGWFDRKQNFNNFVLHQKNTLNNKNTSKHQGLVPEPLVKAPPPKNAGSEAAFFRSKPPKCFYINYFFKINSKRSKTNYLTGSFEIKKFQNLFFFKRNTLNFVNVSTPNYKGCFGEDFVTDGARTFFSKNKNLTSSGVAERLVKAPPKKSLSKILTTNKNYIYKQNILHKNFLFSQHSGEILKITEEKFSKKKSLILTKKNISAFSLKEEKILWTKNLGHLIRIGDFITKKKTINFSGQIHEITKKKLIIRKADSILFSAQGLIHIKNKDCIEQKNLLVTLFYQKLKTEDIIQGIPKIEELFEARQLRKNQNLRENIHGKLFLCMNKYKKKYPLKIAVRKSIKTIQQILITNIQKVYQDQGVAISDKHMEIIIRQMTTKVFILESGTTGLLQGELVDLKSVEIINLGNIFILPEDKKNNNSIINQKGCFDNDFATDGAYDFNKNWLAPELKVRAPNKIFYFEKSKYEPVIFGITKASLETESFISAASFQETTRILSRASIEKKIDFLRGLKENVILGRIIPGGTGFFIPKILNNFIF